MGKPTDYSTVFPLTDLEWKQLLNAARKQTVEGIVYEGLSLLPEKWLPAENILFRWAAEAEHIEQRNQKMNGVLAELQQLFTAHGLHPVVLKGQATALCYRQPSLRQCGDIDWFFPSPEEEQQAAALIRESGCRIEDKPGQATALCYRQPSLRQCGDIDWFFPSPEEEQQAAALIRESGCRIEDKPDGSRLYAWKGIEVEHHPQLLDCCNPFVQKKIHHWIAQEGWKEAVIANGSSRLYAWKGIEVEHHPQLLDCCNPFVQKKIHHWIAQEGWKEAVIANGITISTPAPLLHLLLLNTHILKHALGRGIGLRQLCDLARAYATVGLHADGTAYQEACSQLGLLRWNRWIACRRDSLSGSLQPTGSAPLEPFAACLSHPVPGTSGRNTALSRTGTDFTGSAPA